MNRDCAYFAVPFFFRGRLIIPANPEEPTPLFSALRGKGGRSFSLTPSSPAAELQPAYPPPYTRPETSTQFSGWNKG